MNNETKSKLFTIISETQSTMRFVQLTLNQMRKLFSKEVIKVLSQERYLFLPVDGKVGRFTIVRMDIGKSYQLVLKLSSREFTKLFPVGNYKIFTKVIGERQKKDETCFRENPPKTQPKMVVEHNSTQNTSTKPSVAFPNYRDRLTFYKSNDNYSMIFLSTHPNYSNYYLSDVG
jgi:hypothetical protein